VNTLVNAQQPNITAQPLGAIYSQNETATALTITASVTDGGTLSYQWYWNATNRTTGGTAVGANSADYTPPTTTTGTRYYYVVVTNTNNGVTGTRTATRTSSAAAVTVNALVNAQRPNITNQPQEATYTQDAAANPLTVTATSPDGGSLSYQWFWNETNSTAGGTAVGSNSASYTPPTTTTGTRYYYVVVTNTNEDVNGTKTATRTSAAAAVTVNTLVNAQQPNITDQPLEATYMQYETAAPLTITASVTDGGTLSYQWYWSAENSTNDGTAVGENSESYTPPTTTAGTWYYYVVVTNTNNDVTGTKTATRTSEATAVTIINPLHESCVASANDFYALIAAYATAEENVVIELCQNLTLNLPVIIPSPETAGITLTIRSANPADPVALIRGTSGDLLTVSIMATLILEDIIIDGDKDGDFEDGGGSLINANEGGTLVMNDGAILCNNHALYGGGVMVFGTFIMTGGEISGNTANITNGVYVNTDGAFHLIGGVVAGTGTGVDDVVAGDYHFNAEAPANGIVIAWNRPDGAAPFVYTEGRHDDLVWVPTEAAVFWTIDNGRFGISYKNDDNEGFIKITDVTVVEERTYSLTVTGGTGSGNYAAGTTVTIVAATYPSNQRFKEWKITPSVTFRNATSLTTPTVNFIMPAHAVTATAVFEAITSSETLPEANPLRAWILNGKLHITGLTAGEILSIFSASGALVFHSIATANEMDIHIKAQGVYIIRNDGRILKVTFE